jgi:hypothetical protein
VTPPSSSTQKNDLSKWIPIGFTGTDADTPVQDYNEAYVNTNGAIQNNTHVVSAINCYDFPGGTGTNLSTPVLMAARYLQYFGRPHVKWGILIETDGQPNDGGNGDAGAYTSAAAVAAAATAKGITNADAKPIEVFTVGFLPDGDPNCPDGSGTYSGKNVTLALADMASTKLPINTPNGIANGCVASENNDQDHFFCNPDSADLEETFQTIATDFDGIRTHLVQLSPAPYVDHLSPTSGGAGGVTLTGKYFTGATEVSLNGVPLPSFNVVSDTRIDITVPAGAPGSSVQVIVTNDGGSSLAHAGSKYTYN